MKRLSVDLIKAYSYFEGGIFSRIFVNDLAPMIIYGIGILHRNYFVCNGNRYLDLIHEFLLEFFTIIIGILSLEYSSV